MLRRSAIDGGVSSNRTPATPRWGELERFRSGLARVEEQETAGRALPPPYPRFFGRSEAFEKWLEAREGWEAREQFGARGSSAWSRVRRMARPVGGLVRARVSRLLNGRSD